MRLLLDTHVLLWLAADPERLGDAAHLLADPETELLLSAASAWEITIKQASGRLALPYPPRQWLETRLPRLGVTSLPITWQDTAAVADLPPLHRDPFDRLLVAQARRHDLVLATADRVLSGYDVRRLDVGQV